MSRRLDGIQILRFVAAVMVLIQHAVFLPSLSYGLDVMPFRRLWIGTAGVYAFFVISGYVIARLIDQSPSRFALHRLARIYPPYIAAIAIAAVFVILTGGIATSKIQWQWSYTLLPLGGAIDSWTRIPFWTLIYEITFYIVTFVLMFGGRKVFDVGMVAWAAFISGVAFFYPAPPLHTADPLIILISPLSLLFIAGACLSRAHAGTTWPLAALALVTLTAFWRSGPYQSIPAFAVGSLGAIHFAVLASRWISERRYLRWAVRGGDYSYGLYLFHFPPIYAVLLLGPQTLISYPFAIFVCLVVGGACGLLFGWLDHTLYKNAFRKLADTLAYTDRTGARPDKGAHAYCPPEAVDPAALPGR